MIQVSRKTLRAACVGDRGVEHRLHRGPGDSKPRAKALRAAPYGLLANRVSRWDGMPALEARHACDQKPAERERGDQRIVNAVDAGAQVAQPYRLRRQAGATGG